MTTSELRSRSLGAIGIGVALVVLGGFLLNRLAAGFDPSTGGLVFAWIAITLGAMTVQAGIVGLLFSGKSRETSGPSTPGKHRPHRPSP